MPYKAPHPCAYPGCRELTHERYCEHHKKQTAREYEKYGRNKAAKAFYNTSQWKAVRTMKMNRNPFCEICQSHGRSEKAFFIDHIKEIADGGASLDMENLQSLCHSCHSRKTLQERNRRVY